MKRCMSFIVMFAAIVAGYMAGMQYLATLAWSAEVDSSLEVSGSLQVFPPAITLSSANPQAQVVVTFQGADQRQHDLTHAVSYKVAASAVAVVEKGIVRGVRDGATELLITAGSLTASIPVTVSSIGQPHRIQFENEVLVALSKQDCNSGACHGSPSGKGGFRLSLRAFDPVLDQLTLIREDLGRRTNRIDPEKSLLLLKPLMKVAHGGGQKIRVYDPAYQVLRDWIDQGAKADPPDTSRCVRLEIFPSEKRILHWPANTQQVSAIAHFADGSHRDVTHLASYSSSNEGVASISPSGFVEGKSRGEAVILVRFLEHVETLPTMFIRPIENFVWAAAPSNNYIDDLVNAKLKQLHFLPAATSNDSEFLRRVYLDILGMLPSIEETERFLADTSPEKRKILIDQLLERPEYAKFWGMKWGDLLRMTAKKVTDEGVFKYYRWVEQSLSDNMPYDQFAAELLAAEGSTLSNPPANFYRTAGDMNDCVETISQVFLGARLQCAKCHNHPFERWTQDNYYGLGAFFVRLQRKSTSRPNEMFVYTAAGGEVTQPRTGLTMKPWLPQQGAIDTPAGEDRRDAFVQWLTRKENPYFAKIEVNRIWSHLFARGIVDPVDDFRDSNPPTNSELLDRLASDFAESGYDRKHIMRVILNSRTYQATFQANEFNREENLYFSHQEPRLLAAEQLLNAVSQTTGVSQEFAPFPVGTRATELPAPDLVKLDFLKVFGQPERSTACACERSSESNLGMAIEFFNGPLIYNKLRNDSNRFRKSLAAGKALPDVIGELYLAGLCRQPSSDELKAALDHCVERDDKGAALEDICWAILNTDEFLFQH